MSIALLVMTDGRDDCLARTLASFDEMVTGPVTRRIIHDDSGKPGHAAWLAATYPTYTIVATPGRSGFGGAIRSAWTAVGDLDVEEQWIFHLEDDFLFRQHVDLADMARVLYDSPWLVQLALRRQPWNDAERAAGGIIEQHPDDYTERSVFGHNWLEHRRCFTTNPCMYRRSLCGWTWPEGAHSEGVFTHTLLDVGSPEVFGPAVRFGYWGARDSGEWVEHIGLERVGTGY